MNNVIDYRQTDASSEFKKLPKVKQNTSYPRTQTAESIRHRHSYI